MKISQYDYVYTLAESVLMGSLSISFYFGRIKEKD